MRLTGGRNNLGGRLVVRPFAASCTRSCKFRVGDMVAFTCMLFTSPPHLHSEDERRFIVAAKEGDLPTLRKLLSNGVDVNCRHPLGWTALHTAVVNSNWRYLFH